MPSCCAIGALNGAGANTERGRLEKEIKQCTCQRLAGAPGFVKSVSCCPTVQTRIEVNITPSESSREQLAGACVSGQSIKGGVTQSRARELLLRSGQRQQYQTESTRIQRVQQQAELCFTDPFLPNARFTGLIKQNLPILCPPLPAPPAPPAKACPLTKNQKMLYT